MLLNAKNSKEYYKPFLKIKNTEMINRIKKIITHQPKTIENANIVDKRTVIKDHSRNSYKLFKEWWKGFPSWWCWKNF